MNVVIEGIDGCGKSTQAKRLVEKLGALFWKFPNRNSPSGELIYSHLEKKWWVDGTTEVFPDGSGLDRLKLDEALVFQSLQVLNRLEVAADLARDFKSAKSVVLDRYWPSGYAYGRGDGLNGDYLFKIHATLPQPDLFILLDADVQQSKERRPERRDRYEENHEFMNTVANNYRELWSAMKHDNPPGQNWVVVDARNGVEATSKAVDDAIAAVRSGG